MTHRILTVTLIILLSGCGWFIPPKFDNNEYFFFAEIEAHARFLANECDDAALASKRINRMWFRSETLRTYSHYLPHHSELHDSSTIINNHIIQLQTRYQAEAPPSVAYCKAKAHILVKETRRLLQAVGQLQSGDT